MHSLFPSTTETTMTTSTPWWLVMLAGIAAFLVGLLLLISPGMTLLVLVQILGAYWLVTGILSLVHLCIDRTLWGWKLVSGVLGVLAGLIVLRDPLWSAIFIPTVLVIFLAVDALVMGVTQVIHAFSGGGFGLAFLGILNIVFGIILLFNPLIGALALPIILGIFAVIGGCLMFFRAFTSRHQQIDGGPTPQPRPAYDPLDNGKSTALPNVVRSLMIWSRTITKRPRVTGNRLRSGRGRPLFFCA